MNVSLKLFYLPALFALLLPGCSSIPSRQPDLVRARSAYSAAAEKNWVQEYAPVELYDAKLALDAAEKAQSIPDLIQRAYIADRKAQIAVATADRKNRQAALAELNRKKERLERETRDAHYALERRRADSIEARLAELNAQKTPRGMMVTLGDAQFGFDRAELLSSAFPVIEKLAAFLNEHTDRSALIEGHTDSIGSEGYNLELSQRRAEAVRDALLSRGVPFYRIVSKGYGKRYPVARNDSAAGRQQNRRVEIIILDPGVNAESMVR